MNWFRRYFRRIYHIFQPLYAPVINYYQQQRYIRQMQQKVRSQVQAVLANGGQLRLMIGTGTVDYDGWIGTDLPYHDLTREDHWATIFPPQSIARIQAEHVFEHLTEEEFCTFLALLPRYLCANSRVRIAVPDGYHPDPAYIEAVRPGGNTAAAADHKVLYTYQRMVQILQQQGYNYHLLHCSQVKDRKPLSSQPEQLICQRAAFV